MRNCDICDCIEDNQNVVLSLVSNCEMSKMIYCNCNDNTSIKIYKHLFSWSNISLNNLLLVLKNNLLDIYENYKIKFRFSDGHNINNIMITVISMMMFFCYTNIVI